MDRHRLPTFVIVGAGRSGSTALFRHLQAHPDVFMPREKEIHFFNKDQKWRKGVEWYTRYFADASELALGDATPSYMYSPDAPARMASVIPDARLVAILRNPVDRAYSHYWMNRTRGIERLPFEEALAAEPGRFTAPAFPPKWAYVDRGRYVHQLRRLCEHYPRDQLLVLVFEDDFRRSPSGAYSTVCRFIGVDGDFVPADIDQPVNHSQTFRSIRLRRWTRMLPRPLRPVTRLLARVNERPASYPPMEPATRQRLLEAFAEDNAQLASWLGRDLDSWRS